MAKHNINNALAATALLSLAAGLNLESMRGAKQDWIDSQGQQEPYVPAAYEPAFFGVISKEKKEKINRKLRKRNRQHGLTLVELLVILFGLLVVGLIVGGCYIGYHLIVHLLK